MAISVDIRIIVQATSLSSGREMNAVDVIGNPEAHSRTITSADGILVGLTTVKITVINDATSCTDRKKIRKQSRYKSEAKWNSRQRLSREF